MRVKRFRIIVFVMSNATLNKRADVFKSLAACNRNRLMAPVTKIEGLTQLDSRLRQ